MDVLFCWHMHMLLLLIIIFEIRQGTSAAPGRVFLVLGLKTAREFQKFPKGASSPGRRDVQARFRAFTAAPCHATSQNRVVSGSTHFYGPCVSKGEAPHD